MTDTGAFSYSFACPFCRQAWKLDEFVTLSAALFSSFEGQAECPRCHGRFSWATPGKLKGERWYEGLPRFKNGRCAHCGKAIDGRRKFCSVNCRQAHFYSSLPGKCPSCGGKVERRRKYCSPTCRQAAQRNGKR